MLPTITGFGRTFSMYGIMGAIGFIFGLLFIILRGYKKKSKIIDDAIYVYAWGGVGMLAGAKVLYIFTVLPSFINDLKLLSTEPILFSQKYIAGGMVFYGGLIGAITGAWIAAHFFNHKLSDFYQLLVPPIALVAGFGRIGCFCEGCCYGIQTLLPIGVTFVNSSIAPNGVSLIPTQLMEATFDFIVFFILAHKSENSCSPYLLYQYIFGYAIWRFCIEFVRGDAVRGFLLGLSTSQWISMVYIVLFLTTAAIISKSKVRLL